MQEPAPTKTSLSRRQFIGNVGKVAALGLVVASCKSPEVGQTTLVTAAGTTPGTSSATSTTATVAGPRGLITVGTRGDVPTMDPYAHTDFNAYSVQSHVFDQLIGQDANGGIFPRLAVDWVQESPTSWRFALREGVTFHDGTPFTSASVKESLEYVADPANNSPHGFLWGTLDGVETPDDLTAVVHFVSPNGALLNNLTISYMLPPGFSSTGSFFDSPIGTGPFRMVSWDRAQGISTEVSPEFWGASPAFAELDFRFLGETSARVAALQTGEIDIADGLPPDIIAVLDLDEAIDIKRKVLNESQMVQLNGAVEPFNDIRVRQAMNYGVDRQAIIDTMLLGYGKVADAPMPDQVFAHHPGLEPYTYDPDRAKALMAEAGVDGFSMRLETFRGFFPKAVEVMQVIGDQWAELGIEVSVDAPEQSRLREARASGDYEGVYTGWGVLTADPDFALGRNFLEGNLFNYENADVHRLLREGQASANDDERSRLYREAQEILWTEAPWVYLWFNEDGVAVRNRIQGYEPRADKIIVMRDVSVSD